MHRRIRLALVSAIVLDAGVSSGRHTHPGEEFGYVLEGTFAVTIDGKPTATLKAGEVDGLP